MANEADFWIAGKIRGNFSCNDLLTEDELQAYQLEKIRESIALAKNNSEFYKKLYSNIISGEIKTFEDFEKVPFTCADDIRKYGKYMVTVHPDEIERIVTLQTSGTTKEPKRLYFTKEDLELTIDYFHNGMKCMTTPKDTFLILLPAKTPSSVGDLLRIGMKRMGAKVIPYGLIDDYKKVAMLIRDEKVTSLVGNPVQILILAETARNNNIKIRLNTILLSTDYVPVSLSKRLNKLLGCKIFEHYGMTEMGLGGGIFCKELKGYHIRENDLYIEVIDKNGNRLPDGEYGEVVFTTLTRKGMPVIRYKTGDYGRWKKQKCPCGSPLRLLDRVSHRIDYEGIIPITLLDECLFSIDFVVDYDAYLNNDTLTLYLKLIGGYTQDVINNAKEALCALTKTKLAKEKGLKLSVKATYDIGDPMTALKKRKIIKENAANDNN
jgi:phenylacetate-CoA ligase